MQPYEVYYKKSTCTGCGACVNACVSNAINMAMQNGFRYPVIDMKKCSGCEVCRNICPANGTEIQAGKFVMEAYAAQAYDQEILKRSSSGGIFTLLAEEVLDEQGSVCAAQYNENWQVEHALWESKKQLGKAQQSKYVQSDVHKIYRQVLKLLEQKKKVLFCGTPCQVAGLRNYLPGAQNDLYCVDLICHGVPDGSLWEKYIQYCMKKVDSNERPIDINMRDKTRGWKTYSCSVKFPSGHKYSKTNRRDPYMILFRSDCCLRDACYECKYRKEHFSDIVLGDFWGIEKYLPIWNDDKGTSLIQIRSEKGKELFNACFGKMRCERVDIQKGLEKNVGAADRPRDAEKRLKAIYELAKGNKAINPLLFRMIIPILLLKLKTKLLSKMSVKRSDDDAKSSCEGIG